MKRQKNSAQQIKVNIILFVCAISGILLLLYSENFIPKARLSYSSEMIEASELMKYCIERIVEERKLRDFPIDKKNDINMTGLIGEEFSEITTSTGSIEAKRTVTNPDFAGLMFRLYKEAGLREGDTVVIGASGSFPGAVIASLCAANVMKLNVIAVFSLGASNWGANIPQFNIFDMYNVLEEILPVKFISISLGGSRDSGRDMGLGLLTGGRDYLIKKMEHSSQNFLYNDTLEDAINNKLQIVSKAAGGEEIGCFINIGGADANIGAGLWSLELHPGINRPGAITETLSLEEGGIAKTFLDRGISVINILNIKELSFVYGLSFDPYPFPEIGEEDIFFRENNKYFNSIILLLVYISLVVLSVFGIRKIKSYEGLSKLGKV